MGHRADIPHIVRKGVLHLGCARALGISLGVLTLSATISTTVGNQEAEGLFALPSSLYRRCEGVSDPKPITIFNENRFLDTGRKSRLQHRFEKFVRGKTSKTWAFDEYGKFSAFPPSLCRD